MRGLAEIATTGVGFTVSVATVEFTEPTQGAAVAVKRYLFPLKEAGTLAKLKVLVVAPL
jgi:hypothetical protein